MKLNVTAQIIHTFQKKNELVFLEYAVDWA